MQNSRIIITAIIAAMCCGFLGCSHSSESFGGSNSLAGIDPCIATDSSKAKPELEPKFYSSAGEISFSPEALQSASVQRVKIYRGSIALIPKNLKLAGKEVIKITKDFGGYIQKISNATFTVKIPAAKFQDAMKQFSCLGKLLNVDQELEDVTAQTIDLAAKLKNLQAQLKVLQALLAKSKTVKEILEVRQAISKTQTEIDQVKGKIKLLQHSIAYSIISVQLLTPAAGQNELHVKFPRPIYWLSTLGLEPLLEN